MDVRLRATGSCTGKRSASYGRGNQATVYVRLRGLKPDAVYLEEQSGRQYSGAALMHAGIPFRRLPENMRHISLLLQN